MGEGRTDEPQANRRLTVAQAAATLGISEGAVRSRIKRGTLPTTREGGTVFVLLGGSTSPTNQPPNTDVPRDQSELVEALREQAAYLRGVIATRNEELARRDEEIRRRDEALEREQRLAAFFAERIREIEAPASEAETSEGSEEASESPESPGPSHTPQGDALGRQEPDTRPWWRRWLEG